MATIFQKFPARQLGRVFAALGGRLLWVVLLTVLGWWAAPAGAQEVVGTGHATTLRVGYLAEVPVSWRTGFSDPLRNISRSLATAFLRDADPEYPMPADENLIGAASWEDLSRVIQLGGAEVFPLQAYEFVEQEDNMNLKPLLLATRRHGWQTRFVVLTTRTSGLTKLGDLEGRKILIHRDGCGNLVDYWLESAIAIGTGKNRKGFARYETVTQPREAVLPVFFGEADACVVSLAAYQSVAIQNQVQITQKMAPFLAESKDLPSQVIACNKDLPADAVARVRAEGVRLAWDYGEENGGFIVAEELALDNLRTLLKTRRQPPATLPPPRAPAPPAAKYQTAAPVKPTPDLPKIPSRP